MNEKLNGLMGHLLLLKNNSMKKLILASSSSSRHQLLSRLFIPFETVFPNVQEKAYEEKISDPVQLTKILARIKAKSILTDHPNPTGIVVIGSDQLAHLNGQVLGKPMAREQARQQLLSLRGKTHELITSVSLCDVDQRVEWTTTALMTMKDLAPRQIDRYLEQDNPLHCAGSYRIERLGIALFEKIVTDDYTAIMGLPLMSLSQKLSSFGLSSLEE